MNDKFPIAFAAYNTDDDIRFQSTSGGVFTLLAVYLMEKYDAVVYGAVFDEQFNVIHDRADSIQDLSRLRGSKYPQSRIGDTFKDIRDLLSTGRTVFFTGTPCQVAGLKRFLGKEYETLYCLDFVCHGVASDLLWRNYIDHIGKRKKIRSIVFKHKATGWKKWHFYVEYEDGTIKHRRGYMTMFMGSYLAYSNVRPSCYHCRFKGLEHEADFTISDCWGAGERDMSINDDKGLSALLLQNERARSIFNEIKSNLRYKQFDANELMKDNWTTFRPVPVPENRKAFFESVARESGIRALQKYYEPSLLMWIRFYYRKIRGTEK